MIGTFDEKIKCNFNLNDFPSLSQLKDIPGAVFHTFKLGNKKIFLIKIRV